MTLPARRRLLPPAHTGTFLAVATLRDAPAIAALRNAASARLTERFGAGPWGGRSSEAGVRFQMTRGVIYLAREGRRPVATLALSRRRPWAIDASRFTPARDPLYLTSMAVRPDRQGTGLGRRCLAGAWVAARDWGAGAVRLDAWDAPGGAGGFYGACGMREVGRASYRGAKLLYYERTFDPAPPVNSRA